MRRWKVVTAVVIGMLALSAVSVIASGVLPYRLYVVHTGSMEPTIPSTSAVVVREHEYSVGQPISFVEDGEIITHRLMRINADGTIDTKGDANATNDPWHPRTSAIIGQVVAAPPELGYWLMYLKNPLGLASILFAALVFWQIWSMTSPAAMKRRRHRATARNATTPKHGRGMPRFVRP